MHVRSQAHVRQYGIRPLYRSCLPETIQNFHDGFSKCLYHLLPGQPVINQEMTNFVSHCETLFFWIVGSTNKHNPVTSIGDQTPHKVPSVFWQGGSNTPIL